MGKELTPEEKLKHYKEGVEIATKVLKAKVDNLEKRI